MMELQHMMEESAPLVQSIALTGDKASEIISKVVLRSNDALVMDSLEAFGLFMQFASVGFLFALLPALNYPIFNVYLQMEGYQTASYTVLVNLGWSFKVLYGMLVDCIPIFGYRRKPWMLCGWTIALTGMILMACMPIGDPYCDRRISKYCKTPYKDVPSKERQYFNLHAPDQGTTFIILSMFVSMGYVMVEVASDALMIEYGQRESFTTRGQVQTISLAVRYGSGVPALLITAFGLNGIQYNGSFSFSLTPNMVYAIGAIPCVSAMFSAAFLVVELSIAQSITYLLVKWSHTFWSLVQKQALWQLCAFKFINSFLRMVSATPLNPIRTYWAHVEPVTDCLATMTSTALFSTSLYFVSQYGLHWNWRWSLTVINMSIIVLDASAMYLTTWNIFRNQWIFSLITVSEQIPQGMNMVVGSFCAIELTEPGTEGTIYGLLATMVNTGTPLSSAFYRYVDSFFHVSQNDIKTDTVSVRWDVTYVYLISYLCKVLALVPLTLLPSQKIALIELKKKGISSKVAGALVLGVCCTSLIISLVSNVLSVIPATKCFRLAGGNGHVNTSGWCTR